MNNDIVHVIRKDILTTSVLVSKMLDVPHRTLLKTIRRLSTHGITDEIIPSIFKTRMGQEYDQFLLSPRVVTMLETIYLFKGFGDGEGYEPEFTPSIEPDTTYIMVSNGGGYKIGCTSNIRSRLQAIQVGNKNFIEVCVTIRGGKEIEKELHEDYADKHISGEWFDLSPVDVTDIFRNYITKAQIFDTLDSLIGELNMMSRDDVCIKDFTNETNAKVLKKLKLALQDGIKRKLPYEEIYYYAKEEVEKLVDALGFVPKLQEDN